jgi:hypothetical protein
MTILLLGFLFVLITLVIGLAGIRFLKIELPKELNLLSYAAGFVIGIGIVSAVAYIAWIMQSYSLIPAVLAVVGVVCAIVVYKKLLTKEFLICILVFIFAFGGTVYTSGNNFDLLWDAKASWMIKAKSFITDKTFPGELFTNPITSNIAKDYPTWTSHYYGALAKWDNGWSEVMIKYVQTVIILFVLLVTFVLLYYIAKTIYKQTKVISALGSFVLTGLVYGNTYTYLYSQSGYIDFTILLHWLLVIGGLIYYQHSKEKTGIIIAGVVALCSLLVKNEGMAILLFYAVSIVLLYKKELLSQFPKVLWIPTLVVASLFGSWQLIKLKFGFSGGIQPPSQNILALIVRFFTREAILVLLFIWEWVHNIQSWFLSYTLGMISVIYLCIQVSKSLIKKKISESVYLPIAFFVSMLLYLIPYGIADLGIGFYFESTRDRIALQLIAPVVLIALITFKTQLKKV